ncbi:MAG: hypothetical protein IJ944_06270 [Clostridia bacterium]|nr:hypothetical protein [Clostridia bacterium]
MWCENCKRQFETEEKNCPECGKELIDYTPILDEDADLSGINDIPDALAEEVTEEVQIDIEATSQLLVTVIGEKEAKRVISLLVENNIPAFEKASEVQTLDELDGIEWDDDLEDDEFDDDFVDEDVEVEILTPPETEDGELLSADETLYDIFVPEAQFPEAMSLMLEKDKDMDATIIDELAEIIPTEEEFEESFEQVIEEDVEEEIAEETEEVTEETEKVEGEKSKGGFWNLFRK